MWGFAHYLLANQCSNKCQESRDQSSIKSAHQGPATWGGTLFYWWPKDTGPQRDHQIHTATSGFGIQPACLLFFQVPQGGLPSPKAARSRCEAHLFFTPPLLSRPARNPIYTSNGLDRHRSTFSSNFYRNLVHILLVVGEMFHCISLLTCVELLIVKKKKKVSHVLFLHDTYSKPVNLAWQVLPHFAGGETLWRGNFKWPDLLTCL